MRDELAQGSSGLRAKVQKTTNSLDDLRSSELVDGDPLGLELRHLRRVPARERTYERTTVQLRASTWSRKTRKKRRDRKRDGRLQQKLQILPRLVGDSRLEFLLHLFSLSNLSREERKDLLQEDDDVLDVHVLLRVHTRFKGLSQGERKSATSTQSFFHPFLSFFNRTTNSRAKERGRSTYSSQPFMPLVHDLPVPVPRQQFLLGCLGEHGLSKEFGSESREDGFLVSYLLAGFDSAGFLDVLVLVLLPGHEVLEAVVDVASWRETKRGKES